MLGDLGHRLTKPPTVTRALRKNPTTASYLDSRWLDLLQADTFGECGSCLKRQKAQNDLRKALERDGMIPLFLTLGEFTQNAAATNYPAELE